MSKVTIKDKVNYVTMSEMKSGEFAEVVTGTSQGEVVFMQGNGYVSTVGCSEGDGWSKGASSDLLVRILPKGTVITVVVGED
jgi:hypothetical protein